MSLTYLFKKNAITLQYSYTNKPIKPFTFNYNSNEETTSVLPLNFTNKNYISLETSIPFSYRFWSSENIFSVIYSNSNDKRALETFIKPYVYYYSNQKFSIDKTTSFNLNLWGTSLQGENAFTAKPLFTVNTSIQKKIKNIDVTLNYNDIFKSLQFGEKYTLNTIKVDNLFFVDTHEISLSLKYDFGSIKKSTYRNKNINNVNRIR